MNSQEIKELIDYFVELQSSIPALVISGLALLASFVAIGVSYYTFLKQRDGGITEYLSVIWNDLIDKCLEKPEYLDITSTEHYFRVMDNMEVLKYEAYCYKVWRHVEDIVVHGKHDDKQFEPIIRWVTTYHYTWLRRNPAFFNNQKFWEQIEKVRMQPQMIFGYRKLPSKDDDIDWDMVCEDYYNYILSPFSPEMVSTENNGNSRNLLINYLKSIPSEDLSQMAVLDFGCGPGNLIPHVAGKVGKLICIDTSEGSINKAAELARSYSSLDFDAKCCDILDIDTDEKYDIIISSNSILPKTRAEVLELYKKLRELLKPSGKLLAILPSFDTTVYLRSLWEGYYKQLNVDESQLKRISEAFTQTKLMDENTLAYADDGHNIQSYHTRDSIIKETALVGLKLVTQPEKIYYPWELTKRFDYGYFPSSEEEIWDWFVVAERGEIQQG